MKLVMWDIDHTLVATRGVGRGLFGAAFRNVTGCEMQERAAVDGMTDATIFREAASLQGIDIGPGDFERFAVALTDQHVRHAAQIRERGHALPGAAAGLSGVASLGGVRQTVVTGNIRGSAEIKLQVFGLDSHVDWSIGAYGEDADERSDLVRLALDRSRSTAAEAVLIGDTPSDIEAGRANEVRVIAVASGRSDESELRDAGATIALPGLANTEALLKAVAQL